MKKSVRAVALFLVSVMLFGTLCSLAGCKKPEEAETYHTVSFETDGGTPVASGTVRANTAIGGMYFESGIYIEACENDNITVIFDENEQGSVSLDDLIPATGRFMDITTGEIETRVIPAKNMKILSDTNLFRVDAEKNAFVANMEKIRMRLPYGIPSGTITIYYKGANILFSSAYLDENIPELKGFKELCRVTVVYLPAGTSLEDTSGLGEEVSVTYQVRSEFGEETVRVDKVIAGQYYKGGLPSEIVAYCRRMGLLSEVDGDAVTYDGLPDGKHIVTRDII